MLKKASLNQESIQSSACSLINLRNKAAIKHVKTVDNVIWNLDYAKEERKHVVEEKVEPVVVDDKKPKRPLNRRKSVVSLKSARSDTKTKSQKSLAASQKSINFNLTTNELGRDESKAELVKYITIEESWSKIKARLEKWRAKESKVNFLEVIKDLTKKNLLNEQEEELKIDALLKLEDKLKKKSG